MYLWTLLDGVRKYTLVAWLPVIIGTGLSKPGGSYGAMFVFAILYYCLCIAISHQGRKNTSFQEPIHLSSLVVQKMTASRAKIHSLCPKEKESKYIRSGWWPMAHVLDLAGQTTGSGPCIQGFSGTQWQGTLVVSTAPMPPQGEAAAAGALSLLLWRQAAVVESLSLKKVAFPCTRFY